jgi:thiol:disulfide interchange protein
MYHRETQSKTASFGYRRVTAEMLNKARAGAQTNHKFLMVEFGADWCSDCLELSKSLETKAVRNYLKEHFVVLNVDVGQFNLNIDVAKSLGVDIDQGIPTAVFFPPSRTVPSKRLGANQILAYLNDVVEQPPTTIQ